MWIFSVISSVGGSQLKRQEESVRVAISDPCSLVKRVVFVQQMIRVSKEYLVWFLDHGCFG